MGKNGNMVILFLIAVLLAILKGLHDGIKDGVKGINRFETLEESQDIPYYINEQIEAILEQIQAHHSVIDRLNENIRITTNVDKLATLEKKRADYKYKLARLEEKLQNMLEKWE